MLLHEIPQKLNAFPIDYKNSGDASYIKRFDNLKVKLEMALYELSIRDMDYVIKTLNIKGFKAYYEIFARKLIKSFTDISKYLEE